MYVERFEDLIERARRNEHLPLARFLHRMGLGARFKIISNGQTVKVVIRGEDAKIVAVHGKGTKLWIYGNKKLRQLARRVAWRYDLPVLEKDDKVVVIVDKSRLWSLYRFFKLARSGAWIRAQIDWRGEAPHPPSLKPLLETLRKYGINPKWAKIYLNEGHATLELGADHIETGLFTYVQHDDFPDMNLPFRIMTFLPSFFMEKDISDLRNTELQGNTLITVHKDLKAAIKEHTKALKRLFSNQTPQNS